MTILRTGMGFRVLGMCSWFLWKVRAQLPDFKAFRGNGKVEDNIMQSSFFSSRIIHD